MGSKFPSARGKAKVNSLRRTYNLIQQIAKDLRLDEKDEDLKAFYAKLIVYCTIIESRLISINDNAGNLGELLLVPLKQVFAARFFSLSIDTWIRELTSVHENIRTLRDNKIKLRAIRPYLDFGSTPETHREIAKSLDLCEEELRLKYPEDSSQWAAEDLAPQLNVGEPTYPVWKSAQSIFAAMQACANCPCTPAHDFGARLCLGTYRKPVLDSQFNSEDSVDFNMFLSEKEDWQEVLVHADSERLVRITIGEEDAACSRQRCPTAARSQRVRNLCEPIAKIASNRSYRLVFKVSKNELFKLRSERSGNPIDRSQSAVSLDEFLRTRPGSLTEKTKRILAVILGSAVFHLHKTTWLQPQWNSSDVLFFRTPSSAIPLRPFIHTQLSTPDNQLLDYLNPVHQSSLSDEDIDPDDIDPDDLLSHSCPTLVTLAMMLLEVYFEVSFDVLAQKFNVELECGLQTSAFTRYVDVNYVFQACRKDIPQNSQFYLAVENCLDPQVWQDEYGNELEDSALRAKIYSEVVLPLETELSQAYNDIRIEELDRFAQDLDFGSWGQPLLTQDQQRNTEVNSLLSVRSGSMEHSHSISLRQKHADLDVTSRRARSISSTKRQLDGSPSRSETGSTFSEISIRSNIYPRSFYTVGILCALPLELLAVRALFDTNHENLKYIRGDSNTYALGTIHDHIVVAACLPSGEYGTNAAADSASNMKRTFPNIEFCLLVGIGGGAPTQENDIRLGDVVVSLPINKYSGVIQYDRGKEVEGNTFELTGSLHPPPRCLMTAISALRSDPDLSPNPLQSSLDIIIARRAGYEYPGQDEDCLVTIDCSTCRVNGGCTERQIHINARAPRPTNCPEIHYGLIASGNRVLKDANVRDRWARDHGILCFEMEAAGVMNTFPCLVIRGICDYADSSKNKRWQNYAAATAASYAKLLLRYVAANKTGWGRIAEKDGEESLLLTDTEDRCLKRQRV